LPDEIIVELDIKKEPEVRSCSMTRQIDKNHFLSLNVSGELKEIQMKEKSWSILFDKDYSGNLSISPMNQNLLR
jgi:beta-galactosidase